MVYDVLEFYALDLSRGQFILSSREVLITKVNSILEREGSGYRFIGESLAPITTPTEIEEIERAISDSASASLDGVRIHLEAALGAMAEKPQPDYRNSIKESISAVESASKVISVTP